MPNHAIVLLVLLVFLATSVLGELRSHPVAASRAAAMAPAVFRFRGSSKKPTAAWGPGTKAGNGAFYPPHTRMHALLLFSHTWAEPYGCSQPSHVAIPFPAFPWCSACRLGVRYPSSLSSLAHTAHTLTTERARIRYSHRLIHWLPTPPFPLPNHVLRTLDTLPVL